MTTQTVPVHHSLIQPILIAGAAPEAAILLWTLTAALCLPLRAWFLLPLALVCHIGLTAAARVDAEAFPILFRTLRFKAHYA